MSPTGGARPRASSVEMLLLRDRLRLGRFRKRAARDPEKKEILLGLALDRIKKAERGNYTVAGSRKRPGSTIGTGGLNFRVRNGNACFPAVMVTGI